MDVDTYNGLKECSTDLAWQLVKDDVVMQLIGGEAIAVPFIRESEFYDLYSVIIKEPAGIIDKLRRKEPTMCVAGDLQSLSKSVRDLVHEGMDGAIVNLNDPITGNQKLNPDYRYHVSDMRNGLRKTIDVALKHCKHHSVEVLAQHGEIVLDLQVPGLRGIHKAFIIQEVYFVTDYTIHVTVGDKNITECSQGQTRRIPIAFTFKKYALMPTGMLGTQKPVDLKAAKKFFWIERRNFRSPHDALPNIPSGSGGFRNHRNSLPTVPENQEGGEYDRENAPLPPPPSPTIESQ